MTDALKRALKHEQELNEQLRERVMELETENKTLRLQMQVYIEKRFSAPSTICKTYHIQMCHCCDRIDCCDNISTAKQRITELENQLQAKYAGEVDDN